MAKCLEILLIWKDPQLFLITQELTPQGQMKVSQSRQAYLRTKGTETISIFFFIEALKDFYLVTLQIKLNLIIYIF